MKQWWIIAVVVALSPLPALSGEIIGNTYIGEKNGYIEILSPNGKWEIEDREGKGAAAGIARLRLKDPINGSQPTILFFGFPRMDGSITSDFIASTTRETLEKQGLSLEPNVTRRYGGKAAITLNGTLTKGSIKVIMQTYILEGPKSIFQITATVSAPAHEAAKPLIEEVIENLKF